MRPDLDTFRGISSRDCQLKLTDGRQLGYAEFGAADGRPLFYFHGFPGSRLEAELLAPLALELGIRVIAMDRPGLGLSDFQRDRTFSDWPSDVTALADHLRFQSFNVFGISGGGPYAMACAALLGNRVESTAIAGSVAPLDTLCVRRAMDAMKRYGSQVIRFAPWLSFPIYRAFRRRLLRNPDLVFRNMKRVMPPPDTDVLDDPLVETTLRRSFLESVRTGSEGGARELVLYCRAWDFDPARIASTVHLWHGEKDAIIPVAMGRYLASVLPDCRSTFLEQEGHYSLPVRHARDILMQLFP
jgi:pimeloyl-ACP methyl ester carboxylesterase